MCKIFESLKCPGSNQFPPPSSLHLVQQHTRLPIPLLPSLEVVMAKKKQSRKPKAGANTTIVADPPLWTAFLTLELRPELLSNFGPSRIQLQHGNNKAVLQQEVDVKNKTVISAPTSSDQPPEMQLRGAWEVNSQNPNNKRRAAEHDSSDDDVPLSKRRRTTKPLVATPNVEHDDVLTPKRIHQPTAKPRAKSKQKHVAFDPQPTILENTDSPPQDTSSDPPSSTDKENDVMNERPKLKLKFGSVAQPAPATAQSPPPSALRTPSIKLSIGKKSFDHGAKDGNASDSSAKKRKRDSVANGDEDADVRRPPAMRKPTLTLKAPKAPPPQTPGATLKLTAKAKVKKRQLGVGYDSESEQTELDPCIIEGFILRMQPGPDCDYIQQAISNGTLGLVGTDIRIRVFDTSGRRAMLIVKGTKYAAAMVDLPCIIEGMKTWNSKDFIKSMDICQMMLVLGRCQNEDEARDYPLPSDINHNYQYAHGITPPMHYVRKRRFDRTRRARVDEIEKRERKLAELIAFDDSVGMENVTFEAFDTDPRQIEQQRRQYSEAEEGSPPEDGEEEYSDDEDADGEEETDTPGGYFNQEHDHNGTVEDEEEDFDDVIQMLGEDGEPEEEPRHTQPGLAVPEEGGDSSFAVTSTSASPSATGAAATPASQVGTTDDDGGDSDRDDAEREEDEQKRELRQNIADYERKIAEQMKTLEAQSNKIFRRKLAEKIQTMQQDMALMKRNLGEGHEEEDNDGDGEDGDA